MLVAFLLAGMGLAPAPARASFPGQNGPIAFQGQATGSVADDVFAINPNGSARIQLTSNSADFQPAYSPDGAKIAFGSGRDGNDEIYVINADGTNQTRLTTDPAYDSGPAFSPDGTRIAFASDRGGSTQIWLMNADGTNPTRLTSPPNSVDYDPVFSPDGAKVAFTRISSSTGDSEIFVINTDGTNETDLTNDPAYDRWPDFSPDGSKIAFTSGRAPSVRDDIYTMNADGSNPMQLTAQGEFDETPDFSPDGTKIVFARQSPVGMQHPDVFTMNADGSGQTLLTPGGDSPDPDWGAGPLLEVLPSLSVSDATVAEGDGGATSASFTVSLSAASASVVRVDFATADGTATAGADYQAGGGTLTFAPGETSKVVSVSVLGDTVDEADESFSLELSGAVKATIAKSGVGTIVDDDGPPPLVYESFSLGSPFSQGGWADRGAAAGDLDGDGVGDLWVKANELGCTNVYAVSGEALGRGVSSVIYRIDGPGCASLDTMSSLGDVTGDGVSELVVGTQNDQKAFVFDGKTGALYLTLSDPNTAQPGAGFAGDRFGARVGRAGDVTGDGRSEVIVGAPSTNVPIGCVGGNGGCRTRVGRAYVFDGATGDLVRSLDLPAEDIAAVGCNDCADLGNSVQGPGDVDGDGVPDQLVDANAYQTYTGRMYLFSGKTGVLLRKIDSPAPEQTVGEGFGFQEAAPLSPGDVNGDGRADLYGATISASGTAGATQGRAWVFDGKSVAGGDPAQPYHTPLYELRDPTPGPSGNFGWSMGRTDYDNDGIPDLYIGQAPHGIAGPQGTDGGSYVFSGRDGSLLNALELPEADRAPSGDQGPSLGWFSAAPGDLNGDKQPDYAAGTLADRLYVFVSKLPPTAVNSPEIAGVTPMVKGPPQNPQGTLRPSLAKVDKELRLSKHGHVTLKLRCVRSGSGAFTLPTRCKGTAKLVARFKARGHRKATKHTVGKVTFNIPTAKTTSRKPKISRAARRALRKRQLKAKLTVTVNNPGAKSRSASKKVTLKRRR